ncbi:Ribose ABC transport system, periplasmic ribose-binding protein RbsB (TC 3.A.1.2.1) [Halanaerobium saccharolyticum subsp. saccharolyticum DSM 6643]|uniref:Ribose ABC transport system, periplasmic ribose-binding protein RbsB (TC 3.A.1.2.1) n=1 Tax=Halanaerobium saccharolyticum subsp. saccharolyticum DSM 6643 TaxID=1293054 RepID=M5DZX7_9FIRM|nr:sugar ABC transporter substrate-binding protein [Halanaerobium saccharolyticum]CCU78709.1 Ribose ABC transport system, periplasmic ribose-binding protein RbsB (TC 3.A.1.2.1) [Halanaerobium saccharolyticum subsp. saccharolyticum DSM 6643]
MRKIFSLVLVTIFLVSMITISVSAQESDFFKKNIENQGIKENGEPLQVGITVAEMASEFIVSLQQYSKWMLEEAGAEVTVSNPNYDVNKQMSQIEDFIQTGKDVIIIQATDSEAIAPAVKKANEANIPVIAIVRPIHGEDITVNMTTYGDDQLMGKKAAQVLVEEFEENNVENAKIATVQGDLATANARGRSDGFTNEIAKYDNIEIVSQRASEWKPEKAMAAITDVLNAHPDLDGVFSHNDGMVPGVISALKQSGKPISQEADGHVTIVSVDGSPYALEQIREGNLKASVEYSPLMMATIAVKGSLTRVAKGLPLNEEVVQFEPIVITKENVDSQKLWGNFDVSSETIWPMTEGIWNNYLNY